MRHGGKTDSDMSHGYFLNSTYDTVENKRQRHAILPFSKIDMRHRDPPPPPHHQGPHLGTKPGPTRTGGTNQLEKTSLVLTHLKYRRALVEVAQLVRDNLSV